MVGLMQGHFEQKGDGYSPNNLTENEKMDMPAFVLARCLNTFYSCEYSVCDSSWKPAIVHYCLCEYLKTINYPSQEQR